ncbi:hypothetical protein C8R44DRAFT_241498 [Mycena epipterygia]|nr:hypothetical protein C8R44DRAFT_241498 [Mycena epipterygia]
MRHSKRITYVRRLLACILVTGACLLASVRPFCLPLRPPTPSIYGHLSKPPSIAEPHMHPCLFENSSTARRWHNLRPITKLLFRNPSLQLSMTPTLQEPLPEGFFQISVPLLLHLFNGTLS